MACETGVSNSFMKTIYTGAYMVAQLVRVLHRKQMVRVPTKAANFCLKNTCMLWASCVVLLCLSVVLCCLALFF